MLVSNYRPRSEASEGYVFTGVCHSVTEPGGGGGRWATPKVYHLPPRTRSQHLPPPPPDQVTTPLSPPGDQVTTPPSLPPWDQVTTPPPPPPPRDQITTPPPPRDQVTTPPPPGTMRRRAVRILLECILVIFFNK